MRIFRGLQTPGDTSRGFIAAAVSSGAGVGILDSGEVYNSPNGVTWTLLSTPFDPFEDFSYPSRLFQDTGGVLKIGMSKITTPAFLRKSSDGGETWDSGIPFSSVSPIPAGGEGTTVLKIGTDDYFVLGSMNFPSTVGSYNNSLTLFIRFDATTGEFSVIDFIETPAVEGETSDIQTDSVNTKTVASTNLSFVANKFYFAATLSRRIRFEMRNMSEGSYSGKTFRFDGDATEFVGTFAITGTTYYDGTYTITSSSFSAGKTSITVSEVIPLTVTNVDRALKTFTVTTEMASVPGTITVTGSPDYDGLYTVSSSSTGGGTTDIIVTTTPPGVATSGGGLDLGPPGGIDAGTPTTPALTDDHSNTWDLIDTQTFGGGTINERLCLFRMQATTGTTEVIDITVTAAEPETDLAVIVSPVGGILIGSNGADAVVQVDKTSGSADTLEVTTFVISAPDENVGFATAGASPLPSPTMFVDAPGWTDLGHVEGAGAALRGATRGILQGDNPDYGSTDPPLFDFTAAREAGAIAVELDADPNPYALTVDNDLIGWAAVSGIRLSNGDTLVGLVDQNLRSIGPAVLRSTDDLASVAFIALPAPGGDSYPDSGDGESLAQPPTVWDFVELTDSPGHVLAGGVACRMNDDDSGTIPFARPELWESADYGATWSNVSDRLPADLVSADTGWWGVRSLAEKAATVVAGFLLRGPLGGLATASSTVTPFASSIDSGATWLIGHNGRISAEPYIQTEITQIAVDPDADGIRMIASATRTLDDFSVVGEMFLLAPGTPWYSLKRPRA